MATRNWREDTAKVWVALVEEKSIGAKRADEGSLPYLSTEKLWKHPLDAKIDERFCLFAPFI
jgi:hypothetical protein